MNNQQQREFIAFFFLFTCWLKLIHFRAFDDDFDGSELKRERELIKMLLHYHMNSFVNIFFRYIHLLMK